MSAREFLTRKRRFPKPLVGIAAALGIAVVSALGVAVVIGTFEEARARHEAATTPLFRALGTLGLPVVCRRMLREGCPQAAADRVDLTVAWLPPSSELRFRWFVAAGETLPKNRRLAFEEMGEGHYAVEIDTQPTPDLFSSGHHLLKTFRVGSDVVREYGPDDDSAPGAILEFRWGHGGTRYQLSVIGEYLFDSPPDPQQYERLMEEIRYTEPQA
ncbi:MAG: hypothetical protein ACJ77A_19015 [Actinomycetota bacterium]